jgi:hypothetical protein
MYFHALDCLRDVEELEVPGDDDKFFGRNMTDKAKRLLTGRPSALSQVIYRDTSGEVTTVHFFSLGTGTEKGKVFHTELEQPHGVHKPFSTHFALIKGSH